MQIKIEKLEQEIKSGDWHDKPLRWSAVGPGDERQHFSTKAGAKLYAKVRRAAPDANAATRAYIAH